MLNTSPKPKDCETEPSLRDLSFPAVIGTRTVPPGWEATTAQWSRVGPPSKGDDRFFIGRPGSTSSIVAVIDGASDKFRLPWPNGMGGAATLAQAAQRAAFEAESHPFDFTLFVARTNSILQSIAERCGYNLFGCEERNRPSASIVLLDVESMRVYLIGDCQFGYECNGQFKVVSPSLRVDALTTGLRKLFIEYLQQEGILTSLEQNDPGRLLINDLLSQQYLLRNHLKAKQGEWVAGLQIGSQEADLKKFQGYLRSRVISIIGEIFPHSKSSAEEMAERFISRWVMPRIEDKGVSLWPRKVTLPVNNLYYDILDGATIPPFTMHQLPADTSRVVLATDGVPALQDSVEECISTLLTTLSLDPWCTKKILGTKAVSYDRISYDDGTVIHLQRSN